MNKEEFARLQELFQRALDRSGEGRESFIRKVCQGDEDLRSELESLLAAHDKETELQETVTLGAQIGGLKQGELVGPYRIKEEIGRGGMGAVYLAEDTRLQRTVALKALAEAFVVDPKQQKRFRREAQAAAALSHPGITTIYALEEVEGRLYIASEYVRGKTLRSLVEEGPLPLGDLLDVASQISEALAAAHARGVIHRDLKPENVILAEDGNLKLLDFGLALLLEPQPAQERLTEVGALLGTPSYMAPEQLTGDPVDSRCDIFALGVVLHELASGSNPFSGKTPMASIAKILSADPESNPGLQKQAPDLDRIIRKCLQKDPQKRYQSAEELATDLGRVRAGWGRLTDGEVQVDPGQGRVQPADPPLRSFWWAVHQVIVLLVYSWMVYTAWKVKEGIPASWSPVLFFGVLGCAVANGTLRTHLLFTSRYNRSAMRTELRRATSWMLRIDVVFVLLLLVASIAVSDLGHITAGVLAAVAVGYAVVALVVEPATVRAIFAGEGDSQQASTDSID